MRPALGLALAAVVVVVLAGCTRDDTDARLRLRIEGEQPPATAASVALITVHRVSYVPDPLGAGELAALERAWEVAAAEAERSLVPPAQAELLVLAYREEREVTRAPGETIRVDYRRAAADEHPPHARDLRSYRYAWHDPAPPRSWVSDVLVLDLVEAESGRLLRQVVDRHFFLDAHRHAGRNDQPPADFYEFPLATVLGSPDS